VSGYCEFMDERTLSNARKQAVYQRVISQVKGTYESCITSVNQEHDDYQSVQHHTATGMGLLKFIKYAVWNGTRLASERLVPVFVNAETALKSENQVVDTCLG
jgi:hypothetical protein